MAITRGEMPPLRRFAWLVWVSIAALVVIACGFMLLWPEWFVEQNDWPIWQSMLFLVVGSLIVGLLVCPGLHWVERWERARRKRRG